MKHRSIGKMIGLLIVTLGLYRFFWLKKTKDELNKIVPTKVPSIGVLLAPYLVVMASVGLLIVSLITDPYSHSQSLNNGTYHSGTTPFYTISIIILYLSILLILPLTGYWYWCYAKAAEIATAEKLSFPIAMVILIMIPDGIDMLIFQDYYNKLATTIQLNPPSPTPMV